MNNKTEILKPRIVGIFDVVVTFLALAVIAFTIKSKSPSGKTNLTGINGFIIKNRVERLLSKVDGIKSAEISFNEYEGSFTVVGVLTSWPGNYGMYENETVSQICSIITEETGVPEQYILLYDADTGESVRMKRLPGVDKKTDNSWLKELFDFLGGEDLEIEENDGGEDFIVPDDSGFFRL